MRAISVTRFGMKNLYLKRTCGEGKDPSRKSQTMIVLSKMTE
jgi:hypothetical protein